MKDPTNGDVALLLRGEITVQIVKYNPKMYQNANQNHIAPNNQ